MVADGKGTSCFCVCAYNRWASRLEDWLAWHTEMQRAHPIADEFLLISFIKQLLRLATTTYARAPPGRLPA